jgi:hypothetical protein
MKVTKQQLEAEARRVFGGDVELSVDWRNLTGSWSCMVVLAGGVVVNASSQQRMTARRRLYDVLRRLDRREG